MHTKAFFTFFTGQHDNDGADDKGTGNTNHNARYRTSFDALLLYRRWWLDT
jgi:hypothetical protein